MRIKSKLIHTCSLVHQGQVIGQDPYGQDKYGDMVIENVPCRLDSVVESRSNEETGTEYLTSYTLFFDPGTKLSMDMKVKDLKDKYGDQILPGTFITDEILPFYTRNKLHHFEVKLKRG